MSEKFDEAEPSNMIQLVILRSVSIFQRPRVYNPRQVTHPKTDEQRQRLQEACRDILLFKNLDPVSAHAEEELHCGFSVSASGFENSSNVSSW